jgi:uncharacterized oxidoreductase
MKSSDNTILITGGASGIGFELANQFLRLRNVVIITGRDPSRLDAAKTKLPGVHTFQSDVSDPRAIAILFEKVTREFPELNVLINNAGIMRKINLNDHPSCRRALQAFCRGTSRLAPILERRSFREA